MLTPRWGHQSAPQSEGVWQLLIQEEGGKVRKSYCKSVWAGNRERIYIFYSFSLHVDHCFPPHLSHFLFPLPPPPPLTAAPQRHTDLFPSEGLSTHLSVAVSVPIHFLHPVFLKSHRIPEQLCKFSVSLQASLRKEKREEKEGEIRLGNERVGWAQFHINLKSFPKPVALWRTGHGAWISLRHGGCARTGWCINGVDEHPLESAAQYEPSLRRAALCEVDTNGF